MSSCSAQGAVDDHHVTVLRRLQGVEVLETYPNLIASVARAEARPAHKRAFAAQLAVFNDAVTGPTRK
ncbi:hypothetical protein [Myxococcus landrumensis]|uniref:Uncharacterized protein n=1 Tax=Myxococcus landrumensis TaxID=2813577 RepID=A0ABX7NLY7_9BACT|nr:hypothetical protein [Myxococcus landrumus]QSQ18595.1 hypothetical protein JY572_18300 [Myxococcus landrumus]